MQVEKSFKFKLEPSDVQIKTLYQMAGCGRVVYNDSLTVMLNILKKELSITDRKELYKKLDNMPPKERIALKKLLPNSASLNKQLTGWKKQDNRAYLDEVFTDCLQQRQRDLCEAVNRWCAGRFGFPVFKQRKLAHHSTMRFPAPKKQIKVKHKTIQFPRLLGDIKYRNSRDIQGEMRNVTVSLNAVGNWHVSFMCIIDINLPEYVQGDQVGIDMGIAKNMTCSTDTVGDKGVFVGVNSFKRYQDKLANEQRKLSRMVKGSANWNKQRIKVAKLHKKITDTRRDYQHKATTEISNNHAMVVCEALKVKNMSKSAKGDQEQHGKNVAAKSGLNKSILDQGWHELRRQLEYKMKWKGGIYAEVDPRNTSRECDCCGHTDKANRTTQADFECVHCGYVENADKNAARVILSRYIRNLEQTA